MKTKSDFMRDAKTGNVKLRLIGGKNYEWIKEKRPQNLNPRAIVKTQTNAVYLEGEENGGKGSYLQIPAASLLEYDGNSLKIYNAGVREMNAEEMANMRRAEEERKRFQEKNPYSDDYWHMKAFYMNCSTPWIYSGNDKIKGKRAAQGADYGKIIDDAIKGELILMYAVEKQTSVKARQYLPYELHDGEGETGGISYIGETLKDFLSEVFPDEDIAELDMEKVNKALEECGIEKIAV